MSPFFYSFIVCWILLLILYIRALFILTGDFYIVPGVVGYSIMETYFQNAWSVYTGSSSGGETV